MTREEANQIADEINLLLECATRLLNVDALELALDYVALAHQMAKRLPKKENATDRPDQLGEGER